MTDGRPFADYRAEIDRRLEAALEPEIGDRIPMARATIAADDDRWYGRLLVRSYGSVTDTMDPEALLSAAAAIELLRAYCRLRRELLVQIADDLAHSLTREPASALLAGDFLYSAAYSALGESDHASLGACFATLTRVSERMVEAFGSGYVQSASTPANRLALIDETAGALGAGAAVIGATLAGVDSPHREDFATLGRGLAAGRQNRRTFGSGAESIRVVSPEPDERQIRRHARRRLAEADEALSALSSVADVSRLRPLFEGVEEADG